MKYSMVDYEYGSYTLVDGQENEEQFDSILSAMKEANIFRIIKSDGSFIFEEQCNKWYCLKLTKDQVLALADELIKFVSEDSTNARY